MNNYFHVIIRFEHDFIKYLYIEGRILSHWMVSRELLRVLSVLLGKDKQLALQPHSKDGHISYNTDT